MSEGPDGGAAVSSTESSATVHAAVKRAKAPFSPGLLVLAVFGFLVLSVVYMESVLLPELWGRVVAEMAFVIPLMVSVTLCGTAYRRSVGAEKRFWLMAAALNAVLLVSELYYLWWILSYGGPPPGIYAPFQAMHVVAAAFFYLLLASMTRLAETARPQRLRWTLDLLSASVVTYVIALELYVDRVLEGVRGVSQFGLIVAAFYPTWGVLMILGTVWTMFRPGAARWRLWERMIAVSLVIYALGITAWPIWYAAFQNSPGAAMERSLLDLVLVLGHYLFTMAAAERLIRREQAWPARRSGPRRLPSRTVTYAAVTLSLVALPVLVTLAVFSPVGSLDRLVFGTTAALVGVLMVARTVVAAVENGRLFHRSVTDPLTGLFTHRYYHERLASDLELAQRYDEPLSVLSLDLDDFDALNRRFGHQEGDEVLRGAGAALRRACRSSDTVCRVGADEFAAILRDADAAGALQTALRAQVELRAVPTPDAVPLTASIGVACHPLHASDADTLIRLADGAAYWAKQHGKDQVLVYDPLTVSELSVEDRIRTIEERTQLGTVRALALAVDSRNGAGRARSAAVAGLAASVARRLGLAEDRVRLIETAALLHDVGMVSLGDDVLAKAGPLDEAEWEQVRQHPVLGEQIVGATMPEIALPWIRHHHERWDGDGYPDRLRAVSIPLEARIIAVADAWSAMTSERPYRPAMTPADAARELREGAGVQFDPAVVDVFLESIGEADGTSAA